MPRLHTEEGWLAFGSGDATVLVENSFTSLPDNAGMGANGDSNDSDVESNPDDYFSELGFLCNANYAGGGGASGRMQWNYTTNQLDALLIEGQLSIDVSRSWLCAVDPDSGSDNSLSLAGTQQLLGFDAGAQDAELFRRASGASGTIDLFWNGTSCTTNKITGAIDKLNVNSLGKDDYVRLNVGWWREGADFRVVWGIEGVVMFDHVISGFNPSSSIVAIRFGAASGGGFRAEDVYIKNLVISSKRPEVQPTLPKVVFWGDSQTNGQADGTLSGRPHDLQTVWAFAKELARQGHYCDIAVEQNGGFYVSDDGTPSFLLSSTLGSLSDALPGTVVCVAGTNDARNFTAGVDTSFQTDYQSHINAIKAFTNVGQVITVSVMSFFGDSDSDTVDNRADREVANLQIKTLNNVDAHVDAYKILGAESPLPYTFKGQYGEQPLDDLHLGTQGAITLGTAIANQYINLGVPREVV